MLLKKVTLFLLIGIFLFNIAGYFIAFKVVRHQIKKEIKVQIKKGLSTSQLTSFTFKKENLKQIAWKEEGKEFYYLSNLFDIVRSSENNTSITYYCINDKQEEVLFENLDEHIDKNVSDQKSLKNRSSKKSSVPSVKLYFNAAISFEYAIHCLPAKEFSWISLNYTSTYPEISSPPPELI